MLLLNVTLVFVVIFVICCLQGHVLANKNEMIADLVLNSSIRALLTRKCLVQVSYTRDCISEVMRRHPNRVPRNA